MIPLAQAPDTAGHDDRHLAETGLGHHLAQFGNTRIRVFGLQRIFAVGQSVVTAGEPRVFVDDAAEAIGELMISALPQRAERARGRHDRIIVDAELGADFGHAVRHAGAAGNARDQTLGAFEHAFENALGSTHLPQDVHVDRAVARRCFVSDARLSDAALNAVDDQFFVAFAPGAAFVGDRREIAVFVVGVGVDAGERADAAARSPSARRFAVRDSDALTAFDQR